MAMRTEPGAGARFQARIGDAPIPPAEGWSLAWVDREQGIARLIGEGQSLPVVVEGEGTEWAVTLLGRRVPVTVRSWREQIRAEAELETGSHTGPVEVKATLPGLVVAVEVEEGRDVAEGDPLLTVEAMKMQNEVRAPRAGRVGLIAVRAGEKVSTGQLLLRIE
jgi:biotin carboxyl carrier protein